ncbi:glycosyltransferase family 4 protein [Fictibacillus sp. Mic-4]|uniref:glycosyltransferase family 4 protein n=1 Tax=Fictibacillus TaxID=1329200 RepID=UPI00047953E9|nr:glycosyltransferase family 4 protein [Fictibacillus gelatini]
MKICHLTSVHPADDIRIFVKECCSLRKAGHDVTLVATNTESCIRNGVKVAGARSNANNRLVRMIKASWAVYKEGLAQGADIYHFHDPELIGIGLLLKWKGKKVIYDVHEDVPEQVLSKQWIPKPLRKWVSSFVKTIERFASRRFDAVVAATPTIGERFQTYNPNTVIIHNFPILQELLKEKSVLETNGQDRRHFIYIGGITYLRGIKQMVEAMDVLNRRSEEKLVLAGNFSPEPLKDEVKELPGWRFVDDKGWLDREAVVEQLAKARAGLVLLHPEPRYMVSYPIKLFEYMAAGIPSIASNFPLWREFVEGNQCGICVNPLHPEEIAKAMKWLIDHPEEARRMGENGRKAVIEKYNWEKESEELVRLYESLHLPNEAVLDIS